MDSCFPTFDDGKGRVDMAGKSIPSFSVESVIWNQCFDNRTQEPDESHPKVCSARKRMIRSRFAGRLENWFLADIAEARQNLAIDGFLIFEDRQGPELEPPLLELEQCDGGIAGLTVTGERVNEHRPGHAVDSAVHGVHPMGVMLRIVPVEQAIPKILSGSSTLHG